MVRLEPTHAALIACTKVNGVPEYLDGNKLFFRIPAKGKDPAQFGVVDLTESRTKTFSLSPAQYPLDPQPEVAILDEDAIGFATWMLNLGSWKPIQVPVVPSVPSGTRYKTQNEVTLNDFRNALKDLPSGAGKAWKIEGIVQIAHRQCEIQTAHLQSQLDRCFEPIQQLDRAQTSMVLEIFNFEGDKKALVSMIRNSLGVELKDSDVTVERFGSRRILGLPPIESLI